VGKPRVLQISNVDGLKLLALTDNYPFLFSRIATAIVRVPD